MTLDVNGVKSPGRRLAAALFLAAAGFGLAGCGSDTSSSSSGGQTTGIRDAVGTVSGVITDTKGNFLSGAQVTAVVAKKLAKDNGPSFTATTGANGHFVIANVPVVNAANATGAVAGGAVSLAIVAPAGFYGATANVYPQAQVISSEAPETGGSAGNCSGGSGNTGGSAFAILLAALLLRRGRSRLASSGNAHP